MLKKYTVILMIIFIGVWSHYVSADDGDGIKLKLVWESPALTKLPVELMTAVDLNGNKIKELLITNFSYFANIDAVFNEKLMLLRESNKFHFMVWEWNGKEMQIKWKQEWPPLSPSNKMENKYFYLLNKVRQIKAWPIDGQQIIEAYPPYFHLEWKNGKYQWKEQYDLDNAEFVGSWVFPFQSRGCYFSTFGTKDITTKECLMSIRQFGPKVGLRIISKLEIKEGKQYKTTLRVRRLTKDFPLEWEGILPAGYGTVLDPFNEVVTAGLLFMQGRIKPWNLLTYQPESAGYAIKDLKGDSEAFGMPPFFDVKAGMTQKKGLWEYWGFKWVEGGEDGKPVRKFIKMYVNDAQTEILKEDISFSTHDKYIGIGSFTIADLDEDGLDEVIFIEETGKREGTGEHGYHYSDVADYVRVLKWNGKSYEAIWESPPLKKRSSKVMVDDVIGKGKKQIVVGTGNGTIQIWERQ